MMRLPSLRAKRSNPESRKRRLDCFVATLLAMTVATAASAGWVWNSRSISAEDTNSTVAKPWLNLRAARKRASRSSGSGSPVW